jgi:beta-barrel assembly-enhancing protease
MTRRLVPAARLLPIALLALSCAQLVNPVANVNFMSVEQERQVGEQFAKDVESKQRVVTDGEIGGYVQQVGQRLVGSLTEPEFTYRFRVVEDPSVNAFNIGGGYVYVHSGLLAAAGTEGQVASVLAHEIGHQVRRHVAKTISRQQLFQTLTAVAVGPNSSQWIQLGASLGLTSGQLYFGREAEREADKVMVGLMTRAGWDPREALGMFEKLKSLEGRDPGRVAGLFSSHPPTGERIEFVKAEIARLNPPADLRKDSARFREIRDRAGGA